MKLINYICQLQTLLRKFDDIDIKYCTTYEFENGENREEFVKVDERRMKNET
jgi:hypothetical protein